MKENGFSRQIKPCDENQPGFISNFRRFMAIVQDEESIQQLLETDE